MSEYRRFVAYIYEYTNGKKNKNTGFAKVESRNGVCRMQIHLQKIPREEKALNIYGFVREGGWLLGILLGKICVQGNGGEARLQTPAGNIGGSGYALSQLAGMWVESGLGRSYLTVFDDEGIDTAKLVKELPETARKEAEEVKGRAEEEETESPAEAKETKSRAEEAEEAEIPAEVKETKSRAEEAEEAEIPAEAKETESRAEEEETEVPAEAKETKSRAEEEETEVPAEAKETEGSAEKAENHVDTAEEAGNQTEEKEKWTGKKEPAAAEIHKEEAAGGQTDTANEGMAGSEEEKGSERLHAQETAACPAPGCPYRNRQAHSAGLDQKWKMLNGRCPHFRPFADDELADCIQITPRELHVIRQGNCRMGNNSFLMHGFCNYRHLLFGRLRNGGYLLGIPGIFENQELFMANMFGFPEFKEAASRHPQGRFGYWCRRL